MDRSAEMVEKDEGIQEKRRNINVEAVVKNRAQSVVIVLSIDRIYSYLKRVDIDRMAKSFDDLDDK